ncbi:MAG: thioredoxin domain-containing protein, partial [Proteobacteria bacterium]|nr:thioredoxin domain-containing protein [Pseudomonadota bacterium]
MVVFFLFIFFSCTTDFNINQNNLVLETSAYLKQHDQNPIHWQRWDNDLYNKWNKEQKLLVVSIGYSSCHWCHVMEKETFKDSIVSNYMNKHFINIKVDREENPEIDNIYLTATQMMTGSGGWPLNVVCLPNGKPIYGGTYHTKAQWIEVLNKIQKVYESDKAELVKLADQVMGGIQEINRFTYEEDPPV